MVRTKKVTDDPDVGTEHIAVTTQVVRGAVTEEIRRRVRLKGATGVCDNCHRLVRPAYIDAQGRHTAILTYGKNRVACGGRVWPIDREAPA